MKIIQIAKGEKRSRLAKPLIIERFDKILGELGIEGGSIPARELQAMTRTAGIRSEDNELSRAIIEMREE